jgi:hypothetical protein
MLWPSLYWIRKFPRGGHAPGSVIASAWFPLRGLSVSNTGWRFGRYSVDVQLWHRAAADCIGSRAPSTRLRQLYVPSAPLATFHWPIGQEP